MREPRWRGITTRFDKRVADHRAVVVIVSLRPQPCLG
jgi:hypothetical protein